LSSDAFDGADVLVDLRGDVGERLAENPQLLPILAPLIDRQRHQDAGDDDQKLGDEMFHGDPGRREGSAQCRRGCNRVPVNCPVRQFRA